MTNSPRRCTKTPGASIRDEPGRRARHRGARTATRPRRVLPGFSSASAVEPIRRPPDRDPRPGHRPALRTPPAGGTARSTTQNAPSTSKRAPIEEARPARTRAIPVNDGKMACSAQSVGDAGQPPRQTFETAIVERYRAGTFPSRRQTNNSMEPLLREACRSTKVLGTDPDGHPASMPVAAPLRHVSTTHWGLRRYMNMKSIGEMDNERACSAA